MGMAEHAIYCQGVLKQVIIVSTLVWAIVFYCVLFNLLHVINYLIFDKHGQEFKISNGNNKNNTNQSVNIFSSVTVKRLFCQSLCWIGQSVHQSVCQSVTLRAQIFAELIFRIYDLIPEIKFNKFKKYQIFSNKTLSFSKSTHWSLTKNIFAKKIYN